MSFLQTATSEACACLEVGAEHGDDIDESRFHEGISMNMNTNCICGHTCRVLGPDYRPASKSSCVPGRTCYKSRGHF